MSSGSSETFFSHKGGGQGCGLKTFLVQVQLINNEYIYIYKPLVYMESKEMEEIEGKYCK